MLLGEYLRKERGREKLVGILLIVIIYQKKIAIEVKEKKYRLERERKKCVKTIFEDFEIKWDIRRKEEEEEEQKNDSGYCLWCDGTNRVDI